MSKSFSTYSDTATDRTAECDGLTGSAHVGSSTNAFSERKLDYTLSTDRLFNTAMTAVEVTKHFRFAQNHGRSP